jgi:hypothetical protein
MIVRKFRQMADLHPLIALFGFFLGVVLCFWRTSTARGHLVLCGVAAFIWVGLLLFEPQTRTPMFGFAAITSLVSGLSQKYERAKSSSLH